MNKLVTFQSISPFSTNVKFYELDKHDLDGDYIPGFIKIHFDFEIENVYDSKNISKIKLKTWYRVYALELHRFGHFEFITTFETLDTHSTLSLDECEDLVNKHKEDFLKRISPRTVEFSNGEVYIIDDSTFHNLPELAKTFYDAQLKVE